MSSSLEEGQYQTAAVADSPSRWERWKQTLLDFWKKCSNDWIFNFSGLLAYSLLMAIFPLFLVLLAIAGLSLNNLSPDALASLSKSLASTLPGADRRRDRGCGADQPA